MFCEALMPSNRIRVGGRHKWFAGGLAEAPDSSQQGNRFECRNYCWRAAGGLANRGVAVNS
jgi:hypothetical protein